MRKAFRSEKVAAKKYSAQHFLSIRRAFGEGELDNAYWAPGTENPAGGKTTARSDMGPPLRRLGPGHFNPGSSRPLKGVAWKGRGGPLSAWGSRACARKCFLGYDPMLSGLTVKGGGTLGWSKGFCEIFVIYPARATPKPQFRGFFPPVRCFTSFCCCGNQRGFSFPLPLSFFYPLPTGFMSGGKDWEKRQERTRWVADLSKGLSPIGEMAADSRHCCHDSGNQPDAPT